MYDEALAPTGLTANQFSLLAHAANGPDASIGDLAERLAMDPTTLRRSIAPLAARGLLVLKTDVGDRRIKRVGTTPAGHDLYCVAIDAWRKAQVTVDAALSDADLGHLNVVLDRAIAVIEGCAG